MVQPGRSSHSTNTTTAFLPCTPPISFISPFRTPPLLLLTTTTPLPLLARFLIITITITRTGILSLKERML